MPSMSSELSGLLRNARKKIYSQCENHHSRERNMVVGDHREGLFYSLCGEEAEDQGGLQELAAVYSLQGNANVIGKTRVLPLSPHPRATGISLIQDLIQLSMGT